MPSAFPARVRWIIVRLVPLWLSLLGSAAFAGGLGFVEVEREGVGGVDGVRQADAVAVSPDGAHVYVAGRNDDAVAVFSRALDGSLTFVEQQVNGSGGVTDMRQPSGIVVATNDAHVYVTSALDNAVVVFSRNVTTGALTFVESKRDGVGGVAGLLGAADVAMSPDGLCVYAAGQLSDALAVFGRNVTTGALTFVEQQRDGVGGVDGLKRATAGAISPDGLHVYVAGQGDDAVAAFSRNVITCALTFVEVERDGVGGVDGIERSTAVALSPDGASVYVTGEHDNAVATFSRNAGTGALTFVDAQRDGTSGVSGLKGAQSVVVSADGAGVYVAGEFSNGVAFFHRDGTTGGLSFFESYRDGKDGVDGLDGVFALAGSPDGRNLYSAARGESAAGVFTIDSCGDNAIGSDDQCDDGNLVGGDGCSSTCRLELCPAVPQFTCNPAGLHRATLSLRDLANSKSDSLSWSWRGGATTPASLGDPTTTTDYVLCVYDGSGGAQPRLALAAPRDGSCRGRPCWIGGNGKFHYKDVLATPDGLRDVFLASGASSSSERVTGKGIHLFSSVSSPPLLPIVFPMTVQLVNSAGTCWDSVFTTGSQTSTSVKVKN